MAFFVNPSPERTGDDQKQRVYGGCFALTCFCRAFRKALSMKFLKRLYSQLKRKAITELTGQCMQRKEKKWKLTFSSLTGGQMQCTAGFLLPGSTVEFDAGAADCGCTADAAHRRSARLVALDGNTCRDSESIDIQIKRSAVLSVKREESLLQREYHKMDFSV